MKLVIDVGNSKIKLAVFNTNTIIKKISVHKKEFINQVLSLEKEFNIHNLILSSVANLNPLELDFLKKNFTLFYIDHSKKLPFQNLYETPKTLGVDRLALTAGAVLRYPHKNVLIIDAGTCLTYDFISKDKHYLGGAISPGVYLRYKSLNAFTAKLPLLDVKLPQRLIGKNTNESIHAGVVLGIVNEIDGLISTYRHQYLGLTVILTGGDSLFLSDQLKNSIFVHSDILLEGLNYIFEFNQN